MARVKSFAEMIEELYKARKSGQLFVQVVESSEDLFRIYIRNGEMYYISYGSAIGQDALDIIEYYRLGNATFLEGSTAPAGTVSSKFNTTKFIELMRKAEKTVRVP